MTNLVTEAGGPWYVTATLNTSSADSRATLLGSITVPVVAGWANYTDLGITHSGGPYYVTFMVSEPEGFYTEMVVELDVDVRPLSAGLETDLNPVIDQPFLLSVILKDDVTDETVTKIDWKVISC